MAGTALGLGWTAGMAADAESGVGRFRAKREPLERVQGRLPESHGQNLALTVLYVA